MKPIMNINDAVKYAPRPLEVHGWMLCDLDHPERTKPYEDLTLDDPNRWWKDSERKKLYKQSHEQNYKGAQTGALFEQPWNWRDELELGISERFDKYPFPWPDISRYKYSICFYQGWLAAVRQMRVQGITDER